MTKKIFAPLIITLICLVLLRQKFVSQDCYPQKCCKKQQTCIHDICLQKRLVVFMRQKSTQILTCIFREILTKNGVLYSLHKNPYINIYFFFVCCFMMQQKKTRISFFQRLLSDIQFWTFLKCPKWEISKKFQKKVSKIYSTFI